MDEVKADISQAKYAVFDDMQGDFKFFPSYKGWLGAQGSFTVTDKYRGKTVVTWGRPCIWLMNGDPELCTDVDFDWLQGNCIIVQLTRSLIAA